MGHVRRGRGAAHSMDEGRRCLQCPPNHLANQTSAQHGRRWGVSIATGWAMSWHRVRYGTHTRPCSHPRNGLDPNHRRAKRSERRTSKGLSQAARSSGEECTVGDCTAGDRGACHTRAGTRTHMHTLTHARVHTRVHTHARVPTRTHTYTHAHEHSRNETDPSHDSESCVPQCNNKSHHMRAQHRIGAHLCRALRLVAVLDADTGTRGRRHACHRRQLSNPHGRFRLTRHRKREKQQGRPQPPSPHVISRPRSANIQVQVGAWCVCGGGQAVLHPPLCGP